MAYGPPSWRNLAGGIVALVMIIGGALSIIAFARVGSLRGDKYTVYIVADRASGILKGTNVWLQGQKVGVVKSVGFRPGAAVSTVLEVEVMSSFKQFIRTDSPVEFKPGGTFVGAQVVSLRVGSAAAPVLEEGDTLTRVLVIDPDFRSNELTAAGLDFPEIVTSLRSIGTDLSKTQSQFNSLAEHRSGLQVAIRHMSQFSLRKNGTLPLLARDRTLGQRAKIAIERADSLLDFAREPGTLGRIKADTGFRKSLAGARTELDSVRIRIAREDGAAGRFLADAQLQRDLEALSNEIARTLAEFAKHPDRFSPF